MNKRIGTLAICCIIFALLGCSKEKPDNQIANEPVAVQQENNVELIPIQVQPAAPQTRRSGFGGYFNTYTGDTRRPVSLGGFIFTNGNEYSFNLNGGTEEMARQDIPEEYFEGAPNQNQVYTEKGTYHISKEGVYDYLYLQSTGPFHYKEKLGMLFHPRRLYLFDNDELFFASDDGIRWSGFEPEITDIKTSSFLVEGNTRYDAYNFRVPDKYYLRPWVPGTQGDGIGEWIELTLEGRYESGPGSDSRPLDYFIISNGYVSFANPSLYEWNNRVKTLRVVCESEGIDFIFELEDTPQFQEIRLPRSITAGKCTFRFIIGDVYKGTRWDDTCINLIIPMGEGTYPFDNKERP